VLPQADVGVYKARKRCDISFIELLLVYQRQILNSCTVGVQEGQRVHGDLSLIFPVKIGP
jgi:hypothetical protein